MVRGGRCSLARRCRPISWLVGTRGWRPGSSQSSRSTSRSSGSRCPTEPRSLGYSPGEEPNTFTVQRDRHALVRQANPIFRRWPDLTSLADELFELAVGVVRVAVEQSQVTNACLVGELHCVGDSRMSPADVCTVLVIAILTIVQ